MKCGTGGVYGSRTTFDFSVTNKFSRQDQRSLLDSKVGLKMISMNNSPFQSRHEAVSSIPPDNKEVTAVSWAALSGGARSRSPHAFLVASGTVSPDAEWRNHCRTPEKGADGKEATPPNAFRGICSPRRVARFLSS